MHKITQEDDVRERRRLIEATYQRVYKNSRRALIATKKEWEFYNALLDEIYAPHWHIALKENHGKELPTACQSPDCDCGDGKCKWGF